jgi:hypothetical protein
MKASRSVNRRLATAYTNKAGRRGERRSIFWRRTCFIPTFLDHLPKGNRNSAINVLILVFLTNNVAHAGPNLARSVPNMSKVALQTPCRHRQATASSDHNFCLSSSNLSDIDDVHHLRTRAEYSEILGYSSTRFLITGPMREDDAQQIRNIQGHLTASKLLLGICLTSGALLCNTSFMPQIPLFIDFQLSKRSRWHTIY